jgi:glycine cleavage system regulatory protein
MNTQWILTLLGPDRPGLVEELAEVIAGCGGNWNESRFQQLHGQFAGLVDVTVPEEGQPELQTALKGFAERTGLQVLSAPGQQQAHAGRPMSLECVGQDRPGIVLALSDVFKSLGINVDRMQTSVESAPMSGETLFRAAFHVRVPEAVDVQTLDDRIAGIGDELMLDVHMDPAD